MPKRYKAVYGRASKRLRADYLLKYHRPGFPHSEVIANMLDISVGGLRFWTADPLPQGSLAKLTLMLVPIGRPVEVLGRFIRVCRSGRFDLYNIGVRFLEMSNESQAAIHQLIEAIANRVDGALYVDQETPLQRRSVPRENILVTV